jgi:hypothetical protein
MSNKIDLDKYYTPIETAKYCIDKVYEIIGESNISEVIEPSAGNGAFSLQVPTTCWAYDIEPEHESIKEQDYLELNCEYLYGRLIIGNPPFGSRMNLAQKFFKKSVELGDYVAFILPISQLWNTNSLFEFDLIHSEDLGKIKYSDRNLNCCFNIYKRPELGLNERPKNNLKAIHIIRQDSKGYDEFEDFDLRMCYWGNGSAGKILKEGQNYSAEYKLKIDQKYKNEVIKVLSNINWFDELNCIAMLKIQQFHIINTLKKYIPNIS